MARLMKLHGTLQQNLAAAVRSAQRLRGHPVHADTLQYWDELLDHARRGLASGAVPERQAVERIMVALETEIADRSG